MVQNKFTKYNNNNNNNTNNNNNAQEKALRTNLINFTAQLVEHRTGVAEVTGSNPVEALIFFRLFPSNCLNWKINCDGHSPLSNLIKYSIDKTSETPLCRLCGDATGIV